MPKPYTIRLFIPDGKPEEFKIINKMNWTGVGVEISRDVWSVYKNRSEFSQAGIYILSGYNEDEELQTLYIGQGDNIGKRIESHVKNKLFWDRAFVFISNNDGLNRAHITWLEWALITRAVEYGRCNLDNGNIPNEPSLTEYEKADIEEFFNEILSILPLVDIKVFERAKKIISTPQDAHIKTSNSIQDTIVVPAQKKGFNDVFLGEDCWYAIRIGGGRLKDIKYIAAYQTAPISSVTHYAEVESIEPYGDGGKYRLNFKSSAIPIGPIEFLGGKQGTLQSSRYTTYSKLMSAKNITDLF